jgi:PEP-CTERM motif
MVGDCARLGGCDAALACVAGRERRQRGYLRCHKAAPGRRRLLAGLTVPGLQDGDLYSQTWCAMAVRQGDVLGAVPEPATLASMLAGLGFVASRALARRRRGAPRAPQAPPPGPVHRATRRYPAAQEAARPC